MKRLASGPGQLLFAVALFLGCCCAGFCLAGDEKEKDKPKSKSTRVEVDLSKLPPELAKQLTRYLAEEKKTPSAKGKPEEQKRTTLPPGLANKPKDHPGRVNYLKHHPEALAATLPPGLAKKPKDHPGRVNFLRQAASKDKSEQKKAPKEDED